MRFAEKSTPTVTIEIDGEPFALLVKRSKRANRLILRMDAKCGEPLLVLPVQARIADGIRFAERNAGWIASRINHCAKAVPFRDGAWFPLRGAPCQIVSRPGRGLVRVANDADDRNKLSVVIPGDPAHLSRRLTDWLKREARADLAASVEAHAVVLGVQPTRLRIGDTSSRWGSCSARGTLSFSWRLILAPSNILSYLAAHEVAHLREMNHGPRFWDLVSQLAPDHGDARAWLRRHGADLHAVGRT